MARHSGRVALITGAGRGIGAATAQLLASEGAAVVVADLDLEPAQDTASAIESAGGTARAVACDVADRAQVQDAVDRCVADLGSLDILVTCAGVIRDNLVHKLTEEDWDLVVDTHLKGTFFCTQAAQAQMVGSGGGSMVLLSSGSARGNRGQLNYSAAKAGIQAMAATLALELGRFGIRVNAVAPGFIETRMTRAIAERTGADYEDVKANYARNLALGRVGRPEEIASVISFFASDDASYVTGQTLHVRGSL
jgi:3-oxoacyl-[acyl-carrier protein] reductase